MRLAIFDAVRDPALNLAFEQAAVERGEGDLFLLWRDRPSIIIGRNQNPHREVDTDYVRARDLPVVRRLSGGGAVYHDAGNLCFTFITDAGGRFGDHASFMEPVVAALRAMGVPAVLSGRNDIAVTGLKISGNAQYALGRRLCHHGTLLFETDLAVLAAALRPDPEKLIDKGIASTRARVGNLSAWLPGMTCEAFARALYDHVLGHTPDARPWVPDPALLSDAESIAGARYRSWDWNWGSAPDYGYRRSARFPGGSATLSLDVTAGTITRAALEGDFLAIHDVAPILKALTGCPHDRDAVARALAACDAGRLMGSISRDELLTLF